MPIAKPQEVSADALQKKIDDTHSLMVGVVIAVTFGFIGLVFGLCSLIVDSNHCKASTYQSLVDKVTEQSIEIKFMNERGSVQCQ